MCALFVRDESILRPRFLHLYLSAMCDELLVPLMCGATNVTMNSSQLADIIIPVPSVESQDQVIESTISLSHAASLLNLANSLKEVTKDQSLLKVTKRVAREIEVYLKSNPTRRSIRDYIPT